MTLAVHFPELNEHQIHQLKILMLETLRQAIDKGDDITETAAEFSRIISDEL